MLRQPILLAASLAALSIYAPVVLASAEDNALQDMREAAMTMPPKLLEVLTAEIKSGGHASAISVCRDKAPAMAKALSEAKGMQIRRVSLKNRNPKAVPDAWEKGVLEDFDKRVGEPPAKLEASTVVVEDGKRVMRYMRALPTQDLCLSCHGTDDSIQADVKTKLKDLYPDDKATGYKATQIRGAITVRKTL